MSAIVEKAAPTRTSSGEYINNPLSPPSFGLDSSSMHSSRSDDSRNSPHCSQDCVTFVATVSDNEFSPKVVSDMAQDDASRSIVYFTSSQHKEGTRKRGGRFMSTAASDKHTATKICRVCGDKAYSYNFNVITCESCKAFFRRNANKDKETRCPFNDHCDINVVSRRFCQRCRLQKCFTVGMKKEWIMSDEARIEKKQRVQENRERRLAEVNNTTSVHQKKVAKCDDSEETSSKISLSREQSARIAVYDSSLSASPNVPFYNSALPSLAGGATSGSLPGASTFRDIAPPGSIESLPSPIIANAGFRPSLLTESTNSLIAPPNGPIMQPQNIFISPQQQQSFVDQVAQQAQIQQTAQLEQQLQHQAAVQLVQQQATAHQIVQQQAAQFAAVQVQQQAQQQRLAAAAAAAVVAAAVPTPTPSLNNAPNVVSIALLNPTTHSTPLNIVTQKFTSQLPQNVNVLSDAAVTTTPTDRDMVTIPKDVLLRLVEHNQSGSSTILPIQTTLGVHQKCLCTCLCGRYQTGKLIVDEPKPTRSDETFPHNRSTLEWLHHNSTVNINRTLSDEDENAMKSTWRSLFNSSSLLEEEMNSIKVDPDCCLMTSTDQDRLNELIFANGVWAELEPNSVDAARHEHGCPSKLGMVNMAEGAIRRMIKMVKRIEAFRSIEHHDQILILRNSCMEYIILRGAMSYDPEKNAWNGPTINSVYNFKMDTMKDTQDDLFESTIRFYSTFKEEWRTNEAVMLLLGMVVIFNPDFPNLHNRSIVERENQLYKKVLKRLLYSLCDEDAKRTNVEFMGLLDKTTNLKLLNIRAQRMLHEVDSSQMEPLLREMFDH
uniref:Nuclear hormone receptor family member nhr-48 n=1 Tax=Ascaris suum TaxID=6253 RepID=F1KVF3_ASCSU